ncbi:MAG: hypothetical protein HUJ86_08190, partial [Synergistes sp.]|nr:hypothetical protein [Synergistes sp.]
MTREEMLEKLTSDISPEEKREIGTALLEADPNSPYGKFAIWESMDYEDEVENLDMLREAHAGLRAIVEAKDIPAFADDDADCIIYCLIMINLGYALLTLNESAEAYEVA